MKNNYLPHTRMPQGIPGGQTDTIPWNELVRVAIMLRQWRLVGSHEDLWPLLTLFKQWHEQKCYRYDDTLMDQLLTQWTVGDTASCIWVSYHIGPYGLITRALLQQGIGVAVLLKDEIFHEQYPVYLDAFRQCFGRDPQENELRFIQSGSRHCLVRLRQALDEGLHVLAYIDSDEGGDGTKSRLRIQLHRQDLAVRYGVAVLARWTGVPIRPVMLSIQGSKLRVHTGEDYLVCNREDQQTVMQALYHLPARLDPTTLMQWEMLPHLADNLVSTTKVQSEGEPFLIPIQHPERALLMDVDSLRMTEIPSRHHREWMRHIEQYVINGG